MKPEQASKVKMRTPTRLRFGEGRTDGEATDKCTCSVRRGMWARHAGRVIRVIGEARAFGGCGFNIAFGRWNGRESDRGVVPLRPGNSGGGMAPDFWCAFDVDEDQGDWR